MVLAFLLGFASLGIAVMAVAAEESVSEDAPESEQDAPQSGRETPARNVEEIVILGTPNVILTENDTSSAIGFDAQELLLEGVGDIRDLSVRTPNLEIKTAFAAVNPTLFIRGVGLDDFNANSASAVAVYQDGYYMNSPAGQLFGLYDVAAIEVLRGPQAHLANASAGAILVRGERPKDEYEAYLTSTFGSYNQRDFQGALNVPLVSEILAVRGAFNVRKRDGITKNLCPGAIAAGRAQGLPPIQWGQCRFAAGLTETGFPPGPSRRGKKYVNDVDNWAARVMASLDVPLPGDQEMDWLFSFSQGKNDSLATQFQHTGMREAADENGNPIYFSTLTGGDPAIDDFSYTQDFSANDPFEGEYDRVGPEELDLLGGSATGTWSPVRDFEIETRSGYFWHDRATYSNDDGGPKNWLNNDYTDEAWQFSEELQFRWLWGHENEITLGGYYLTERLKAENILRNNRPARAPTFTQEYEQDTDQWAAFARAHVLLPPLPGWGQFVENFSIDVDMRQNWARKEMRNRTFFGAGGGRNQSNAGMDSERWDGWAGAFTLSYALDDDKSVYAKASRGWKPGHFNANTFRSTQVVSAVEPETVDSLEAGLRASWFDGLLSTNVTGFTYDYQDLQVFQVTVDADGFLLRRLINAEDATIWGVEWELASEPIDGLRLELTGAYLDSEYDKFSTSFERARFVPGQGRQVFSVDVDYSGNRLVASPEWSWAGSIEYDIPLSRWGALTPRFSFSYRDEVFFDANEGCGAEGNIPECLIMQEGYWLLNAALTYSVPGDQIEITGFVRNLDDEEYKVQSFDVTSQRNLLLDVYGTPRTYGVTVTVRY